MKNKINGIDVSECCFYNNGKCDNPNGMACNCINNAVCYFKELKRLREENEGLKSLNDFNVQKIEVLQEENEKLKEQLNIYMSQYEIKIPNKYRQALEEIRKEANRLLFVENPIYGYNNSNYFEILVKYVLAKTDEALEDNENVENNKL